MLSIRLNLLDKDVDGSGVSAEGSKGTRWCNASAGLGKVLRRAGERPARLKAAAAVRAPPTLTPGEALREERRCTTKDEGDGVFIRFASTLGGDAEESVRVKRDAGVCNPSAIPPSMPPSAGTAIAA